MNDFRAKWALVGLCVISLVAAGAGFFARERSTPPIVITGGALGDTAPDPAIAAPVAAAGAKSKSHLPPELPDDPVTTAAAAPGALPNALPGTPAPQPAPTAPTLLYVDVAGAVKHPGLYQIPEGRRVQHAIDAAGGATERADLDALNLAEKVQDGEKIYVPRKDEVIASANGPQMPDDAGAYPIRSRRRHTTLASGQVVYDVPPAPVLPIGAPVGQTAAGAVTSTGEAPVAKSGKIQPGSGEQIDLNTATEADLERLPGVGPGMAQRILTYRQQNGRFTSIDDLRQVSGIGAKRFANMEQYVTAH